MKKRMIINVLVSIFVLLVVGTIITIFLTKTKKEETTITTTSIVEKTGVVVLDFDVKKSDDTCGVVFALLLKETNCSASSVVINDTEFSLTDDNVKKSKTAGKNTYQYLFAKNELNIGKTEYTLTKINFLDSTSYEKNAIESTEKVILTVDDVVKFYNADIKENYFFLEEKNEFIITFENPYLLEIELDITTNFNYKKEKKQIDNKTYFYYSIDEMMDNTNLNISLNKYSYIKNNKTYTVGVDQTYSSFYKVAKYNLDSLIFEEEKNNIYKYYFNDKTDNNLIKKIVITNTNNEEKILNYNYNNKNLYTFDFGENVFKVKQVIIENNNKSYNIGINKEYSIDVINKTFENIETSISKNNVLLYETIMVELFFDKKNKQIEGVSYLFNEKTITISKEDLQFTSGSIKFKLLINDTNLTPRKIISIDYLDENNVLQTSIVNDCEITLTNIRTYSENIDVKFSNTFTNEQIEYILQMNPNNLLENDIKKIYFNNNETNDYSFDNISTTYQLIKGKMPNNYYSSGSYSYNVIIELNNNKNIKKTGILTVFGQVEYVSGYVLKNLNFEDLTTSYYDSAKLDIILCEDVEIIGIDYNLNTISDSCYTDIFTLTKIDDSEYRISFNITETISPTLTDEYILTIERIKYKYKNNNYNLVLNVLIDNYI